LKRLSVLLLCDDERGTANTTLDHIDAFLRYSRHQVKTFNPRHMKASISLDLDEFDVVVIHHSLVLSSDNYVSPDFRKKLARFRGRKLQFMQDEYRWVDRATAASREVGINVLFTLAEEPGAGLLYDTRLPGVRRILNLTGYVPESLEKVPVRPLLQRQVDVAYRGRQLPYWVGRLSQEKRWIAEGFLERAPAYGLRTDIGWREADRIYGSRWIDFIASSRATLGAESGASITDYDGTVEQAVRAYLRARPEAPFEEVSDAVLRPYEGNVMMNVISPRVFEAAALGTAMVMFPGFYSGVVSPGDHYIVLEKDFSNMAEVVEQLRDDRHLTSLVRRAHDDLIGSRRWSYETFMRDFDRVVEEEAGNARGRTFTPRHRIARIERSLRVPPLRVRIIRGALAVAATARRRDFARRRELESGTWLAKGSLALRAALADTDLRAVFREGRRAHVPLDSLLEEILELSILRSAADGSLHATQRFTIRSVFDAETRSLRFLSGPAEEAGRTEGLSPAAMHAARTGSIDVVEWDHRAIGESVRLQRPALEVGIGTEGFKRYSILVQLASRQPGLLQRGLGPALAGERSREAVRLS